MPIPSRDILKIQLADILSTLGPVKTKVVYEQLAILWQLAETEKSILRSERPLYQHEIRWAKQELVIDGIMATTKESGRGIWRLKVEKHSENATNNEEITTNMQYQEGAVKSVLINNYERNNKARKQCIEHYGYHCQICLFDFAKAYGAIGRETIHVHHIVPLSLINKEYIVDPIKDLIPVCPNCHHIIHKRTPPFSIQEVKNMLKQTAHKNPEAMF